MAQVQVGMEDGGADVAGRLRQFRVVLELRAGQEFLGPVGFHGRLRHHLSRQAQGAGGDSAVVLGRQGSSAR
jgi:hypothetical protein